MNLTLTKDEVSLVLDALAALPLARSYNLFQKLLAEVNKPGIPPLPEINAGLSDED